MQTKASTDLGNKYSTGYYQDTSQLIYRLPLEAGTYTLTAGFTEWWNVSRSMYQTVSANGQELSKATIALSGTSTPLSGELTFTITEPTVVEYRVTNEGAGSERPVISWLAVAADADKSALALAIAAAQGLTEGDYTAGSWATFAAALAGASGLMADVDATDAEIAEATAALTGTKAALVSVVVLKAAVALAGSLVESDYSPETWAPFLAAKQAAEAVLANAASTQSEVDAATVALLAAQQALTPFVEPVDTSVLAAALAVANGLVEGDYTSGSWGPFAEARDAAQAVLDAASSTEDVAGLAALAAPPTQEDVTKATTDLLAAQAKLVSIAALAATTATAAAFIEDDYTPESWAGFASALAGAQVVLADPDASQSEVDGAQVALTSAIGNLKALVHTGALEALVASADLLLEADYTPESWPPFRDALAAAKAVLADEDPTQAEVDAAAVALVTARDGLAKVVPPDPGEANKAALQAALDSATPLVEADYTPQSWAPFALALSAARALLADEDATQAEVDAARVALITAQGALVAVDPTQPGSGGQPGDERNLASTGMGTGWQALPAVALILLVLGAGATLLRRRDHRGLVEL